METDFLDIILKAIFAQKVGKKIYAMMLHIASTPTRMHIGKPNEIFSTLKDAVLRAFKVVDKELKLHPRINCYCSGTTAVTLVKQVL